MINVASSIFLAVADAQTSPHGVDWIGDAAQVVNAFAVVVLVAITAYYAWKTKQILDESKKMREAAEKQATVAAETLDHLREQLEDLQGLGKSVVFTAIDSAIRSVEHWQRLEIKNHFAQAYAFPPPSDLVPDNARAAVEHARKVSDECVALLARAFDDLRCAQREIEALRRGSEESGRRLGFFNPASYDPDLHLARALSNLRNARSLIK